MTASAIESTGYSDAYSIDELEAVELNSATTKGLAHSQIRFIKARVLAANEGTGTVGSALYAAAQALSDIKADVKNKNWTALTDSGALNMSGRMARDLVFAYDTWMRDADVSASALAQVSTRTLAKIGRADAPKRTKAINMIKAGEKVVEKDVNSTLGNKKSLADKSLDELLAKAQVVIKKTDDKQKVQRFSDIILQNIRLKEENKNLKAELSKLKVSV